MYGKIMDGELMYFKNPLVFNGAKIYNPSHADLIAHGYKPIVTQQKPDDRPIKRNISETENEIIISWVDMPDELTDSERLDILEKRQNIADSALEELIFMVMEGGE